MNKEVRFAIIGTGVIAEVHAREIAAIPGARLVAVAGKSEERAKAFARRYGAVGYADYRDMLRRGDIDVVNICTPSGTHGDLAACALLSGKHVMIEKPMEITLEKADRILETAAASGLKVAVISQHRFDPSVIRVKREIDSGKLGALVMAEAAVNWYRTQGYYDSGQWRGTWQWDGGGVLMNQSIHTIDILQYLMGPVESVFALTGTMAHERIEVEDVAAAVIRFRNGAIGTLSCTTAAYPGYSNRLEIFGRSGSAVIEADVLTHLYRKESETEGLPVNEAVLPSSQTATGASDPAAISGEAHRRQFEDMIESVLTGREPLVNGEEGKKPLEIILAIYRSAREGRPVRL